MTDDATDATTDDFATTRSTLHHVAVHIVARSRAAATGRFSLRVTPGGVGTPEFGGDLRRVRIADGALVVESDTPGGATATAVAIGGSTLRQLAEVAGVDVSAPLDVGHDTPPVGDVDQPLAVDDAAAVALGRWFAVGASALDRVLRAVAVDGLAATLPRVWPEHFDADVEVQVQPSVRVNLGVSPGDGFSAQPYAYVGPWGSERPGDAGFWNAPFGASLALPSPDAAGIDAAVSFLLRGVELLR